MIMARPTRTKKLPPGIYQAHIDSLTHDGRGVSRIDGKTVFIDGALPGEEVQFVYTDTHRDYDEGKVETILHASPGRESV